MRRRRASHGGAVRRFGGDVLVARKMHLPPPAVLGFDRRYAPAGQGGDGDPVSEHGAPATSVPTATESLARASVENQTKPK